MRKHAFSFGFVGLVAANALTTSGEMAPLTLLICGVACLLWPVADILESVLS